MALDLKVPYTVHCGFCGGLSGHEIRDPRAGGDDWEDCPYCRRYEDCQLCGQEIDCRDRVPDRLIIDGQAEPVCASCWAMERDD